MGDKRIFLALDISDAARVVCDARISVLRTRFPEVRVGWERPEKLHITLKFLGETSDHILAQLIEKLSEIARRHELIRFNLGEPGVFPERSKPRILWIGLKASRTAMTELVDKLENATADLGYERERRRFRPHITIGRVRDPGGVAELANSHLDAQIEPVEFVASEIVIYESKLQPSGSVYSVVSRVPLGRRPT